MKTNTQTPSPVLTSPAAVGSGFTLGLDLGDRQHHVCVLDATGQILREVSLPNTRPALAKLLAEFPRATVALEAGTHSPWISRFLTECGAMVLVANPRKLHAISRSERKCDRRDAQMLARLARVDAALLHPIQHGQRLAGTGSAREKKRAVVAVARKLAVLLLSLWKHGTNYEPRVTTAALVLTPA